MDKTAERTEVPARFSHIPVSPNGHSNPIRIIGNTSAVHMEITEAGKGFSIASI